VVVTSKCNNSAICFNGGLCVNNRCVCQDGFKGEFCENAFGNNADNSSSSDNKNDDGDNSYYNTNDDGGVLVTSKCDNGSSCFNDGICNENKCMCHAGFQGEFCEINVDNKNSNSDSKDSFDDDDVVLVNSRCRDGSFCYNDGVCYENKCLCHIDFQGLFCEQAASNNISNNNYNNDDVYAGLNKCDGDLTCFNGGVCKNNKCACYKSFEGRFCEKSTESTTPFDATECDGFYTCFNGGECHANSCRCRDGYSGEFCAHAVSFYNNDQTEERHAYFEERRSSNSIIFGFSTLFVGTALIIIVLAYTTNKSRKADEDDCLEARVMESLTDRRKPSIESIIQNAHTYPREDKSIADLI